MSSFDIPRAAIDGVPSPVVTGADVVHCAREFGVEFACRLLAYGEATIGHYNRCASVQAAAARSASSSGSSGPRSLARAGAGLTGSRLASIGKVESWRSDGVVVGSTVKKLFPDGMCALKLFSRNASSSVLEGLGEWPTFGALVRKGVSAFSSMDDLEKFRLVSRGQDIMHVVDKGNAGVSFLDAVASYSSRINACPGTLAAEVKRSGRVPSSGASIVTGRTRIGGMSEVEKKRLTDVADFIFGVRESGWKFVETLVSGSVVEVEVRDDVGAAFGIGVVVDGPDFGGFQCGGEGGTVWWPLHAPSRMVPVLAVSVKNGRLNMDRGGNAQGSGSELLCGVSEGAGPVRLVVEAESTTYDLDYSTVVAYANLFPGAQTRRVVMSAGGMGFLLVMAYPAATGDVSVARGSAIELLRDVGMVDVILKSVRVCRVANWMSTGVGSVKDRNVVLNVEVDERGPVNPSGLSIILDGIGMASSVKGAEITAFTGSVRRGVVGYLIAITADSSSAAVGSIVNSVIVGMGVLGDSVRVSVFAE